MKSEPSILDRLDAPTKAPYWPVGVEGRRCVPNQVSPVIQFILLLSNNHILNLSSKRVETWMTRKVCLYVQNILYIMLGPCWLNL